MKDLRATRGKFYLARVIAEGEHETQDFKYAVSDARKIARTLSAFANHSGGRLLIGVRDNGSIAGVRNEEDIYVVEQAAQMYCDPPQEVRVAAFSAEGGAIVVRAEIDPSPVRPVRVREADGRMKAYYRVADENIAAHPLMVRAWQRMASDSCVALLGEADEELLAALRDFGRPVTSEQLLAAVRLSRRAAEESIVTLCATGVIGFIHDRSEFKILIID